MNTPSVTSLRTPAWLLIGMTGSKPGVLELAGGRLGFTTEEGRVFEAPLAEVTDVAFPWFYFGGGAQLTVGGAKHRLSFVKPNGAEVVSARLVQGAIGGAVGGAFALMTAQEKVSDIGDGRKAGKAWKAVLVRPA